MINPANLIYSKAAAARILKKKLIGGIFKGVEKILRLTNGAIQVTYKTTGRCSTFLSAQEFKRIFAEWRKEESAFILAIKTKENWFRCVNPQKGSAYNLYLYQDSIGCECEDYSNQISILKKGCCKHGYAVLRHLGFSSLSEYIEHHRWVQF